MGKVKSAIFKMGVMVSSLALMIGVSSAEAACSTWFHQPKIPQGMEKYTKW